MARATTITVHSPILGIDRKVAYEDEPSGSTYDSLGFLPFDAKTGRRMCATQPGWGLFGPASNPNLISALNVAANSGGQETYSRLLIIANSGTLKSISNTGTSTTIGSGIDTARNVQAATYGDELFIANSTYKVYTYGTGTNTWTASVHGTLPPRCILICEFGGRIVLGGDPQNPHVVNFSRVDEPRDWLFAANDAGSPCASTDISGGAIQEPVIDFIPHNRDCLLTPSSSSFYIYRGNPTDGGTLERLCYGVGLTNRGAWCKTGPDDWTYFMSRDGLYRMAPGCGSPPIVVSRKNIPDALRAVDGVTTKAYLSYDVIFHGILIALTSGEYWWFDIETEGFWRLLGPGGAVSFAVNRFDPIETADKSGVLVGTSGGMYRMDRTAAVGGSTASYFYPFVGKLTKSVGDQAMVEQVNPVFSGNTDDTEATLDFYGAMTVEDSLSLADDRHFSSTVGEYQDNGQSNPRIGGHALAIKLTQSDMSKHVAFEVMPMTVIPTGRDR